MKDTNNNNCSFEPGKINENCKELEKISKEETLKLRKKHIG